MDIRNTIIRSRYQYSAYITVTSNRKRRYTEVVDVEEDQPQECTDLYEEVVSEDVLASTDTTSDLETEDNTFSDCYTQTK